ncbi:MAG TPA: ergothioneine biosynthesis protein EgtB, partial [Blastocatellia bacterium]|nr:ergothioneine biosynthesis protein EgtB [Blastocatellia bacterium]
MKANSQAPIIVHNQGSDAVSDLLFRYKQIRAQTEKLCAPLSPEDCQVQSMTEASPAKWHLAHTSWFFETFILQQAISNYHPFHTGYNFLFNSYYNAVGSRHPRPARGLLTRPALDEIYAYRHFVDEQIANLFHQPDKVEMLKQLIELGLNHEQQHQELILTDIKHLLSINPLRPVYKQTPAHPTTTKTELQWQSFSGGLCKIGYEGEGFCFDNELPRHQVFIEPFELATRLVTNEEYLAFINDGGYKRPELWLSDGWYMVQSQGWQAPLYWEESERGWQVFTLSGLVDVRLDEAVCHVSFYEADAFAHWSGTRLPTEAEWETATNDIEIKGNFAESEIYHPAPAQSHSQLFGDVWEWTQSSYSPYPNFKPAEGAIGEYNGKFMCNQMV